MSRYERRGNLDKLKNFLSKYIPRPGLAGAIGAIAGSGTGFTVGFLGSSIRYFAREGIWYLMNGGGMDAIVKAYEQGINSGGELALVGSLGGLLLFAKCRDYVLEFFGLKGGE
ncbi:MAG: hypothetical protein QXP77_01910 [Candidatus Aenigmatarchaeota archaeon]